MTSNPTPDPTHSLSVQQADALWDAVAIPGPQEPTFPVQHERVCRAVAGILAEQPATPSVSAVDQTTRDRIAEARVRALHQQYRFAGDDTTDYCAHCNQISGGWVPWPCPTVRALDASRLADEAPQPACVLCGHRTCMYGKPCGVIATEREELPEPCGCTGAKAPPADRAGLLLWAADQIDAETRQAKADEVLEPDKFRPCRDASAQLRRLADEAQQPGFTPREATLAAILREVLSGFRQASNDGIAPDAEVLAFVGPTVTPEAYRQWCDVTQGAAAAEAQQQPDTETRLAAATCSAQYHGDEGGARLCIRAAQHTGKAHTDELGFHWSDTVAIYPLADGTFRTGINLRAALAAVPAEQPAAADTGEEAEA